MKLLNLLDATELSGRRSDDMTLCLLAEDRCRIKVPALVRMLDGQLIARHVRAFVNSHQTDLDTCRSIIPAREPFAAPRGR